jgi:hypothetical protein
LLPKTVADPDNNTDLTVKAPGDNVIVLKITGAL